MNKPKGFENDLSDYGVAFVDSYCGEPISWGFKILHRLGDDKWSELAKHGEMECSHSNFTWFLIIRKLNKEEAIEKYGKQNNLELGPRGGFRSVMYGDKKFLNKIL